MKKLIITIDNDKHSKLIENLLDGLSFVKSIRELDDVEAASFSKPKDDVIKLDIPKGVNVKLEVKKRS
ncbi:hypothetical protein [Sediminitomix flava]|uniref:Uncharacterized protein n=1 Tax=Sediminitomix flava TaxID=379075 RepID=A0A315ZYA2_SEDFL|nr:hypothetical protein [Sediminitomix flava]PWJ42337.1 hypothetical protein BC781_103589 [Sediminitomix flava]